VTASGLAYAVTKNLPDGMVPVVTRGGSLSLHFKRKAGGFTAIFLEGPAEKVYHGTIDIKRSLLV
jgi:diaminopimelate epimerase